MTTHLQLWADWIGSLAGPLRLGIGFVVIALVALGLLFGLVVLDQFQSYLTEERVRLPLERPETHVVQGRFHSRRPR